MSELSKTVAVADQRWGATSAWVNVFDSNMDMDKLYMAVNLVMKDREDSGEELAVYLTPEEARELAWALLEVAAHISTRQNNPRTRLT